MGSPLGGLSPLPAPVPRAPVSPLSPQIIGFGSALLEEVDPNPANFVGAGIIHTRTAQIGCLLRLEPNLQAQVQPLGWLSALGWRSPQWSVHREVGGPHGWPSGALHRGAHLPHHHHRPLVPATFPSPHGAPGHPPGGRALWRGAPSFGRRSLLPRPWQALVERGEVHCRLVRHACPGTWGCCKHRVSFVCT